MSTASITINEDDYHRIKGLLRPWPHVANRVIEPRPTSANKKSATMRTYLVLLPSSGDALSQIDYLNQKGFKGTIHEGEISVGQVSSRSAAQVLISRLVSAGFPGAHVQEQEEAVSIRDDVMLSEARMKILFAAMDNHNAKALEKIIGNYGKLKRQSCR